MKNNTDSLHLHTYTCACACGRNLRSPSICISLLDFYRRPSLPFQSTPPDLSLRPHHFLSPTRPTSTFPIFTRRTSPPVQQHNTSALSFFPTNPQNNIIMAGGKGKSSGGKSSGGKTSAAEVPKKQQSHSARAGLQVRKFTSRRFSSLLAALIPSTTREPIPDASSTPSSHASADAFCTHPRAYGSYLFHNHTHYNKSTSITEHKVDTL